MKNILLTAVLLCTVGIHSHAQTRDRLFRDFVDDGISGVSNDFYSRVFMAHGALVVLPRERVNGYTRQEYLLANIDTASLQWEYLSATSDTLPSYWLLKMRAYPGRVLVTSYGKGSSRQKETASMLFLAPGLEEATRNRITRLFIDLIKSYQKG